MSDQALVVWMQFLVLAVVRERWCGRRHRMPEV
jgi:hypothetical protein